MCDNNKLKIYKVKICQSFEVYYFNKGLRYLFSKNKRVNEIHSCDGVEKYILAHNLEEAVEKYKQRTNYVLDECIDYKYRTLKYKWDYSYFSDTKYFLSETPNYKNEYCGCEVSHKSFNFIKEHLTSEDFIAYCKQEMYPIKVLIK